MKKIVIISTDTPHHRYLINSLVEKSISLSACIFETKKLITKFPTKHSFEKDQALFEEGVFFSKLPNELSCNNVVTFDTVNSSNSQRYLNDLKPDLGIVFGTGKIDNNIIRIFKHGLINVHRGMIEKYRGLDSDLWAIYHDDYENIGVTIHMVDEGLDTGDIIYQETLTLHQELKTYKIRCYTTMIATNLVIKAINQYLSNNLITIKQEKIGRYYSYMPSIMKDLVNLKFNKFCERLS